MQKKLIALAVAGLASASGVAVAQTNVTLYGVIDVGYLYSSGNAGRNIPGSNTFSGLVDGIDAGPRVGFKGEEALGNGLKAVFTLEYGISPTRNGGLGNVSADYGGLNARQQFIGLSSSKYGTVALGRQYAPGFNATANNDALDASNLSIQSSLSAIAGDTITPNSGGRFNNAITYTSPTFSGVTFSAIYGFGETQGTYPGTNTLTYNDKTTSVSDNGQWGVGLNYANGPINLDAVYQQRNSVVGSPALKLPGNGDSINEWYVGGAYDFQVVKIYASYQGLHNNNDGLFYAAVPNNNLWTVGLTAPIGRGTFGIGYGRMTVDNKNIDNGNSWGAGLMYTYPLSKRTALYAAYSYFSNSDTSIPGSSIANPGALIGAPGETNYAIGAGVRHSF